MPSKLKVMALLYSFNFVCYGVLDLSTSAKLSTSMRIFNLNYILSLPKPRTTTYGLHSFAYLAAKLWNSFRDDLRTCDQLNEFKRKILSYIIF